MSLIDGVEPPGEPNLGFPKNGRSGTPTRWAIRIYGHNSGRHGNLPIKYSWVAGSLFSALLPQNDRRDQLYAYFFSIDDPTLIMILLNKNISKYRVKCHKIPD